MLGANADCEGRAIDHFFRLVCQRYVVIIATAFNTEGVTFGNDCTIALIYPDVIVLGVGNFGQLIELQGRPLKLPGGSYGLLRRQLHLPSIASFQLVG